MKVKYVLLITLMFVSIGVLFSVPIQYTPPSSGANNNAIGKLSTAAGDLCNSAQQLLKVGIVLMIVLGAATYAIGQVLSSEIRGRATVWATSMFMAALFAAVIYVIIPWIIGYLWGQQIGASGCESLPSTATSGNV